MKRQLYAAVLLSIVLASCGDGTSDPVPPDYVYQGPGGDFYNDDVVSTPPKDLKYKSTRYLSLIDTLYYPEQFSYTIGCFVPDKDSSEVTWKFAPANKSLFMPTYSKTWNAQKQRWAAVHGLNFFRFSTEEFTLWSTTEIKGAKSSVNRSTKINIEVEQRDVDVLHSKFGMSRQQVTKAEKEEMGLDNHSIFEPSPALIVKAGSRYSGAAYTAFQFKDDKLVAVIEMPETPTAISAFNKAARRLGYPGQDLDNNPVTWPQNGIQFTVQEIELDFGASGKKKSACLKMEKI